MPRSAAPAPADARRVGLSWLQHAEAATVDDDDWLRLDGDEDGINGRVADLRLREADLAPVAADVGRRSFARSPLSGAPSNNRAPVLSRTNPSVSDRSSPRTTSISPTSRTPSPPPPRTLTRSSSSPLKLIDDHARVARRLLLPDGRCGEPPRSRRLGAVRWRAIRTAVGEDLIDDLALFLELHEGE